MQGMLSRRRVQNELGPETVESVERLLGQVGPREIARRLRISKNSVYRIKRGEHVSIRRGKITARCEGCGGMVVMPCIYCAHPNAAARRAAS